MNDNGTIVIAGATGDLGGRIVDELLQRKATVKALVRAGSTPDKVAALQKRGVVIAEVDFNRQADLTAALAGAACVVSALSGLREVIVDAQTALLEGAVAAGVPRFIPSDFAIDFAKLPSGSNRNLDLRREFQARLDNAPIRATSVLNGMFTDLLTGPAPIILFPFKRVLYWENADQLLDFTTVDNTAAFTAAAALDPTTPRYLRIAGDVVSARGVAAAVSEVTGENFGLLRGGGLGRLAFLVRVMQRLMPQRDAVFPPWQGMQYLHNMFSGRAKLEPLDNSRYPGIVWTPVADVLAANVAERRVPAVV